MSNKKGLHSLHHPPHHGPHHSPHHGPHRHDPQPHHHHHGPPHLRHRHSPHPHDFSRHIQELSAMGATEADLHDVIDHHIVSLVAQLPSESIVIQDPGRGTDDSPIPALTRARAIAEIGNQVEDAWRASLRHKNVLVAGEFPPHLLEEMLEDGINLTQLHPAHDGAYPPPHFYHLAPIGLRGLISLHELAGFKCDVVLVHGAVMGDEVYVSALVPIVLRMFPDAERHLLEDDHIAPHMILRVQHQGFHHVLHPL